MLPALTLSALLWKGLVICSWKIYLSSKILYQDLIVSLPSAHVEALVGNPWRFKANNSRSCMHLARAPFQNNSTGEAVTNSGKRAKMPDNAFQN